MTVLALAALALALGVATATAAIAADRVETVLAYDAAEGEFPEGIAIDHRGNIFTTIVPLGEVRKLTPGGEESVVVTFPRGSGFGLVGLTADGRGNVYAAHDTKNAATHGVFRISPTGEIARLPGSSAIGLPNALAFDEVGNLYVTDTTGGAVWRIPPGGTTELWSHDALLAGDGSLGFGFPAGANGIAYTSDADGGKLLVANTDVGRIVEIPVRRDGSAGPAVVFAEGDDLVSIDGVAVDARRNVYATILFRDSLVRLAGPGAELETLATAADGLDGPTSVFFGAGRRDVHSVFIANFALAGPAGGAGPSVTRVDVGVPGRPLFGGNGAAR